MEHVQIGRTGLRVSPLILGCMPFGGGLTPDPITKEHLLQAEQAIDATLSIGITMFDHADFYAMGKAEQVFGSILKARPGLREQIIIQSKCGIRLAEGSVPKRFDFSKAHILNAVDGSLRRLGIDYLDILLLHRPDPLMEPDEVAEAFGILKASGKVRYFGVSNMSVAQIQLLQQALPEQLVVNQLQLSLGHLDWLDQGLYVNNRGGTGVNFSEGLLEYSRMEKIQLQAWGPLAKGRFSGRVMEDDSEETRKTSELVRQMAADKETSPEAIVLGWLMRHPAGIQPVIGTTNVQRIIGCRDAQQQARQMSREEWYTLYVSARGKVVS